MSWKKERSSKLCLVQRKRKKNGSPTGKMLFEPWLRENQPCCPSVVLSANRIEMLPYWKGWSSHLFNTSMKREMNYLAGEKMNSLMSVVCVSLLEDLDVLDAVLFLRLHSDPSCSSIPLEAWPSSPLTALPSHPYSFKWCTDKGGPDCLVNYYLCEDLQFKSIYTSTFYLILSPGPLPSLWVSENWASMWLSQG